MNTQQKIAVMQAFLNGKAVESRDKRLSGAAMWALWAPGDEPNWNWEKLEYRVAAEAVRYRRYVRETRNHPGSSAVRTCAITHAVSPGDCDENVKHTESLPGFVRWIDTEWQTP